MAAPYTLPVNKLLTYGNFLELSEIPNYLQEFEFSAEHIPELIRMACDKDLSYADLDSSEVWAPVHAVCVLNQLRAEEAVEPLVNYWNECDDLLSSEVTNFFATIGKNAIPALQAHLNKTNYDFYERARAATALTEVANKHPELRKQCISIITPVLENFANNERTFNAYLIRNLVDLKAIETVPLIEQAFAADKVEKFSIGTWNSVQVELGLKTEEEVPSEEYSLQELLEDVGYYKKSLGFATGANTKPKKNSKKGKKRK